MTIPSHQEKFKLWFFTQFKKSGDLMVKTGGHLIKIKTKQECSFSSMLLAACKKYMKMLEGNTLKY